VVLNDLSSFLREYYEIHELKHAIAILKNDFKAEYRDIVEILADFRLYKSHILKPGGRKSPIAEAIDSKFFERGWIEKTFQTKKLLMKGFLFG
jgi:hypothetical protein